MLLWQINKYSLVQYTLSVFTYMFRSFLRPSSRRCTRILTKFKVFKLQLNIIIWKCILYQWAIFALLQKCKYSLIDGYGIRNFIFAQHHKKNFSLFSWASYSCAGDLNTPVICRRYCTQFQCHKVCWCYPSHTTHSLWSFIVWQQVSTPII
jgi:hypothetical protein